MSWSTSELRVRLAPWNRFKPSSKIFTDRSKAVLLLWIFFFCLVLCLRVRLFTCALWSLAGKGLTSWLSFVVSNCEFVTFPFVSWVSNGTWLYRFLIFAPYLLCMYACISVCKVTVDFRLIIHWGLAAMVNIEDPLATMANCFDLQRNNAIFFIFVFRKF